MGDISIKINIADRVYPLKVNAAEEEIVRKAAKIINERLKEYQKNYDVHDKVDLLSMCVLHYATNTVRQEKESYQKDDLLTEKIHHLDSLLNDFISQSQ
jgi:cell division protein ZapA (FtsZ GTPase activity inhibitor)